MRLSLFLQQSLMLETNLLFGGLSFHDQHRDLRMDIDNMSYEVIPLWAVFCELITDSRCLDFSCLHN